MHNQTPTSRWPRVRCQISVRNCSVFEFSCQISACTSWSDPYAGGSKSRPYGGNCSEPLKLRPREIPCRRRNRQTAVRHVHSKTSSSSSLAASILTSRWKDPGSSLGASLCDLQTLELDCASGRSRSDRCGSCVCMYESTGYVTRWRWGYWGWQIQYVWILCRVKHERENVQMWFWVWCDFVVKSWVIQPK